MSYLADTTSQIVMVTNYRLFDDNDNSIGLAVPYAPDNEHRAGTVYKHSMLGTDILTNRMLRIDNRMLKFAHDKPRLSGRDYEPYNKTNRRDAMATVGDGTNRLIDANYETHGNDVYTVLDNLDKAYKSRNDTKGDGISDLGILTVYMDLALRLLVSGSSFDAVCHALADDMVTDFRNDNLGIAIALPENNSRSRDGKLTKGDLERFAAIDSAIVWLTSKANAIVKIAVSRLDKALEVYQR